MITPDIKIKIDPEEDAKAFLFFLNDPRPVSNRKSILEAHPELQYAGDSNLIRNYISEFYKTHRTEIERIRVKNENKLKDKDKALALLAGLMQYEWSARWEIIAYISILPFSPFSDKKFNYSILGELYGKNPVRKSLLSVAVHEISHMIFFEKLRDKDFDPKSSSIYYLKEAVATVLMNDAKLKGILGTKRDPGNSDIQKIYIQGDGTHVSLVQYVKKTVRQNDFDPALQLLFKQFLRVENQFDEKRKMWNEHGKRVLRDKELLAIYSAPILLK